MLIDTHCHLDWNTFQDDLDQVLERAQSVGVQKLVTIGTDSKSNQQTRGLVRKYKEVYRCVGFHPDTVLEEGFDEGVMNEYIRSLDSELDVEKTVGIGEIGLDYYVIKNTLKEKDDGSTLKNEEYRLKELQKELFERQLLIAIKEGLPVSLHVRDEGEDAYWDALEILSEYYQSGLQTGMDLEFGADVLNIQSVQCGEDNFGFMQKNKTAVPGVLHCVSGSIEYVKNCVKMGFMIGVCGNVTYKKSEDLRQIVQEVDLSMIVLETDAPFLSPGEFRGKRNEPAYIVETAKQVAEIKRVSQEEVERVTSENAQRLYNLSSL